MEKIKAILNSQWELMQDEYKHLEQTTADILVAKEIGRLLLLNNLKVRSLDEKVIKKIIKIYETTFEYDKKPKMQINFDQLVDPLDFDVLGRLYEDHIHVKGTRKSTGQFYSPQTVVNYMIEKFELGNLVNPFEKRFIDIACGTGVFLLRVAKEIISIGNNNNIKHGDILKSLLKNIFGLDINPVSCIITQINLFLLVSNELGAEAILKYNSLNFKIINTNSIENREDIFSQNEVTDAKKIKQRLEEYADGFDYIIGNPPYLEAKKMPKELKEICKSNFEEEIFGAFDLYIAFIAQCNRLVKYNGKISLILPNKFMVAKYAKQIRTIISNEFTMDEIVDLSEMDIFHKADVYPIVLTYSNQTPNPSSKVKTKMSVNNFTDLYSERYTLVPQNIYKEIGDLNTYFCLPQHGEFDKLFINLFSNNNTLGSYLNFRSTVSFHKKGLREQYIKKEFPNTVPTVSLKKYLGGESYSRKNEVSRFNIDWSGYFINYDVSSLKEQGNNLPPLSNFEQEKIIFCQHAKVIQATYDGVGEWVTKDVFPIAFANDELQNTILTVKYLSGILNSSLYSFLYGIIYKGIQISAGYYHYLPTWLSILPVIVPDEDTIQQVESLVDQALLSTDQSQLDLVQKRIDQLVYNSYGIREEQISEIETFLGLHSEPKVEKVSAK